MFLFVGSISGPGSVGAGLTACSIPGMKLHVESSRQSELHNASKSSWKTFSVTSRRGALTSRRQTEKLSVTSRRGILTSRRHFSHVATSFGQALCHVATLPRTSRRYLVLPSAMSRHCPARRNVAKLSSLSRCDVTPHVATWPCF